MMVCLICGKPIPTKDKACVSCNLFLKSLDGEVNDSTGHDPDEMDVDDQLKEFLKANSEVKGVGIVSAGGIIITSIFPQGKNEERVAAMAAISSMLYSLFDQLLEELWKGDLDYFYIKGSNGYLIIIEVQRNIILFLSTTSNVRLGIVFQELVRLIRKIRKKKFELTKKLSGSKNKSGDIFKPIGVMLKEIELEREIIVTREHEKKSTLDYMLKRGVSSISGVSGAILISKVGKLIASTLPKSVDKERNTALTAALLFLAEKLVIESEKGDFTQMYIKGSDGYLLFLPLVPNAALIISTTRNVRLGLLFPDCLRFCARISRIMLGTDDGDDDDERFSYPYIFKPPSPPDDIAPVGQQQLTRSTTKNRSEYKLYCKYCGNQLVYGQSICHVCKNKVD